VKSSLFRHTEVLLLLIVCCGLSACGGHRTRVIETPETRELKGWQKPYEVDGLRYNPLRDHQGFRQEGIASWYGKKFHGRATSNGETYDMYAMTAAHKTLPLGVYVKVTNQRNGLSTVVRINDRGPFVAGRIIDLSYSAASKLDVVDAGTAPVRIEALGYRTRQAGQAGYVEPKSYDVGSYAVQVGAFSVEQNAVRLAADLRRQYGAADVQTGVRDGATLYRVRVGKYTSLNAAEQAKERFQTQQFPGSFVVAYE
jgi:rare lipoprotein A